MATVPQKGLKVQYIDHSHNEEMEESLVILLRKYGYGLVSTGYNPKDGGRELNFELRE